MKAPCSQRSDGWRWDVLREVVVNRKFSTGPNRKAQHLSLDAALAMGPPPAGNLAVPIFSSDHLDVELYQPPRIDPQGPHTRDEVYIVARGEGFFFDGERRFPVDVGSFIFVPAGQQHRFENFSENFAVWVFFYGPEGGGHVV
jgi:mannose-6-phosphate isomerase-like protein (cupin superfamily)